MNKPEIQIAEKGISLVELVRKANGGDKGSLSVLRKALNSDHAGSLMEIAGNLADKLEESTLNAMRLTLVGIDLASKREHEAVIAVSNINWAAMYSS